MAAAGNALRQVRAGLPERRRIPTCAKSSHTDLKKNITSCTNCVSLVLGVCCSEYPSRFHPGDMRTEDPIQFIRDIEGHRPQGHARAGMEFKVGLTMFVALVATILSDHVCLGVF
jgi:hypothetical protein